MIHDVDISQSCRLLLIYLFARNVHSQTHISSIHLCTRWRWWWQTHKCSPIHKPLRSPKYIHINANIFLVWEWVSERASGRASERGYECGMNACKPQAWLFSLLRRSETLGSCGWTRNRVYGCAFAMYYSWFVYVGENERGWKKKITLDLFFFTFFFSYCIFLAFACLLFGGVCSRHSCTLAYVLVMVVSSRLFPIHAINV